MKAMRRFKVSSRKLGGGEIVKCEYFLKIRHIKFDFFRIIIYPAITNVNWL